MGDGIHHVPQTCDLTTSFSNILLARAHTVSIYNVHPFHLVTELTSYGASRISQLNNTTLFAAVGSGTSPGFSPRCLRLIDISTGAIAAELTFRSTIVMVHLFPTRVIVAQENLLCVLELPSLSLVFQLDFLLNLDAVPAVSAVQSQKSLIALPSLDLSVMVFDFVRLKTVQSLDAHQTATSAVAFDGPARRLATASVRGTIVKVFDIGTGSLLCEFHRGLVFAQVFSLSFSSDGVYLACASDTDTVHVYNTSPDNPGRNKRFPAILPGTKARSDLQIRLKRWRHSDRVRCVCRWHESLPTLYIVTAHDDDKDLVLLEYDLNLDRDRFQIANEHSLMPDRPMNINAVLYDDGHDDDDSHDEEVAAVDVDRGMPARRVPDSDDDNWSQIGATLNAGDCITERSGDETN